MRFFLLFTIIILAPCSPALADIIYGKVIGVSDGDTITVLTRDKEQVKVRLTEIDAPEKKQPYGDKSKQALSDLIFQKEVKVDSDSKDRYGRTLGRVYVGTVDVNLYMVENGYAWAYTRYVTDPAMPAAEMQARKERIGLWSLQEDQITPPWMWRKGTKRSEAPAAPQLFHLANQSYSCTPRRTCKMISSCQEAYWYLTNCPWGGRLDGDSDGVPCESICR